MGLLIKGNLKNPVHKKLATLYQIIASLFHAPGFEEKSDSK